MWKFEAIMMLQTVNLHFLSEVRDQGNAGCCFAFTACQATEYTYAKETNVKIVLSPQDVYENNISSDEEDKEGKALQDAFWWMKHKGCVLESSCLYRETWKPLPGPRREREVLFYIDHWERVKLNKIKTYIKETGPVAVRILWIVNEMENIGTEIYHGPTTPDKYDDTEENSVVPHTLLLIGYGAEIVNEKTVEFWLLQNSHGKSWGNEGIGKFSMAINGPCGRPLISFGYAPVGIVYERPEAAAQEAAAQEAAAPIEIAGEKRKRQQRKRQRSCSRNYGSLSTTSSVVRGVTSFAAVTSGKIDLPGDKVLGLAKKNLGIGVPGSAKDFFNQVESLTLLESERVTIPLVLSLPATVYSLSRKDQLKELQYDQSSGLHVLSVSPDNVDVGTDVFVFEMALRDSGSENDYAIGGQIHVPICVTGIVKVSNAEITVLDSDLGSDGTEKMLDLTGTDVVSLSANHLQKLRFSFQLTTRQVLLKLRHKTKYEHIFLVRNTGKKFEIILDFLGLVDKFYYLSGRYDFELTVGDAVMENSFLQPLGHLELDLPEAPEKASRLPPNDGTFYFDEKFGGGREHQGSLSTTSSVVRGVTSFAAANSGKIDLPGDKVLGLAKNNLGIGVPGSAKDFFNQVESLALFESKRVPIPLVLSFPATVYSLSKKDQLKVTVNTVLGSAAPPLTFKVVRAFHTDAKGSAVIEGKELQHDQSSGLHVLNVFPDNVDVGTYVFVFEMVLHGSGSENDYAIGGQIHVPIYVTGIVKISNAEIAVLDSDPGSDETQKTLDLAGTDVVSLSANHLQKLRFSFQLTTPRGHVFKPHQVLLKLRHETKYEHIFVVQNTGKKFEIILDFLGLVDKFYYLSGRYDFELTVGDAVMENSFLQPLGHLELDLPEAPEKAARLPPLPVDSYSRYGPKADIAHLFRTLEKQPP
ncbi:senescence-specific cysteine protease SAG39 [Trifolium repens]|nr:senescence-specific cysteine protease SAG39 [Trifolium repens]